MKLRIKGNSMRLRIARSEVARLVADGRVAETIRFAAAPEARLTYALEAAPECEKVSVLYRPQEVAVLIPSAEARAWAASDQVGIYANLQVDDQQTLELIVEKDWACLDRSDADNQDTFPNPHHGAVC